MGRPARLIQTEGLRAPVGCGRKPRHQRGPLGVVANVLDRDSTRCPNRVWVTDITPIRTYEGCLFPAAGGPVLAADRALGEGPGDDQRPGVEATVAACKPGSGTLVHSDQGCPFTSSDWQSLMEAHRMVPSMNRCVNCHDNAVAESFFDVLKKEPIKRRLYPSRQAARTCSMTSRCFTTRSADMVLLTGWQR